MSLAAVLLIGCDTTHVSDTGWDLDPSFEDSDSGPVSVPTDNPVAVCEVSRGLLQPPFETATLSAEHSYDPQEREIVGYEWSLTQAPLGSAVSLSAQTGASTSLIPQLAGTYRVELNIINELGLRAEEPCVIDLKATPDETLWVSMFWSHQNDNMDLHLLQPGGSPRTDSDCYHATCRSGLDWGTLDDAADDPILSLDDVDGVGPENISIAAPEAGEFTVFVHDEPGSVREEPTNVTVNIYVGGELAWTDTRAISGEDTDTMFATVNPTTGVVTPL